MLIINGLKLNLVPLPFGGGVYSDGYGKNTKRGINKPLSTLSSTPP